MQQLVIDTMQRHDLDAVLALQAQVYDAMLLEDADFYLNRMSLSGASCLVARAHESICGYLVSYPWDAGLPPALNTALPALPADAETWFLHDCAVAPSASGRGVAAGLLAAGRAWAQQAGLKQASLVSLAHACGYWQRHGFAPVQVLAGSQAQEKLAGYGEGACWMTLAL